MKKFSQIVLLIITIIISSNNIYAHDFEVDGIFYNIANETIKTCNVTFKGTEYTQNDYSGDIIIPSSVTYNGVTFVVSSIEDYAFYKCTNLTSIIINAEVTTIGNYAFYKCSNLSQVLLGHSLLTIESLAFSGCTLLKSITFPASLTNIDIDAFSDCTLQEIYSLSPTPPTLYYNYRYIDMSGGSFKHEMFSFSNWDATVYVPKGSAETYKATKNQWAKFTNFVELEEFPSEEYPSEEPPMLTLSIEYPEGAVVKIKEEYNVSQVLNIAPVGGWYINTVTFNEENVTEDVDTDGNYVTPILTEDSRLSIVLAQYIYPSGTTTPAEKTTIKVFSSDNIITIEGADINSEVLIYDAWGYNIYSGIEKQINISLSGIYIVVVEGQTFKLII